MAAPRKIAVIGAGVAGLLAAQQLKHEGEMGCRLPAAAAAAVPARYLPKGRFTHLAMHPLAGFDVKIVEKTNNVGGVWQSNYAGYALQASSGD